MKIFISHATEDKDKVARPLAKALQKLGYEIWFDEYSLKLGDSLTAEIDKGLIECDYGVVILSKSFFSKKWTQKELAGFVARETSPSTGKTIILPVWHEISAEEIKQHSLTLADRIAVSTNGGLKKVVDEIVKVVGGQEKNNDFTNYKSLDQIKGSNSTVRVPSLVAFRIATRENMLNKGTLRQQKNKDYNWSPDIDKLVKKANCGDEADLWSYMFFSYRTIYINATIDETLGNLVVALMIYLNRANSTLPIHLYINTLGGQVYAGLSIYDIMTTLSSPVYTYGLDSVAGSGCFLLAAGKKGYRFLTKETKFVYLPIEGGESSSDTDKEIKRLQGIIHHITSQHTTIHQNAIANDFYKQKKIKCRRS